MDILDIFLDILLKPPQPLMGLFLKYMSLIDDSRAIWVLFRKWVLSENQSFLNVGVIVKHLLV